MRAPLLLSSVLATCASAAFTPMNGEYAFANQLNGTQAVHRGTGYFDVYTPVVESLYAQVNWKTYTVPLDPEIVKAWDGKLMNLVGYEFDIVTKNQKTGEYESVPAWEQYNHHYGATVMGKASTLVKTDIPKADHFHADDEDMSSYFPGYKIVNTVGGPRRALDAYSAQAMIMGNGAESRKTFHYIPPGYGAQVKSPYQAVIHPMIIDTKNRNGNGTTRHGMVPQKSNVAPDAMYSGLMECPCTDKYPKVISSYSTAEAGVCAALIPDAATCYTAAAELGLTPIVQNASRADAKLPTGCIVTPVPGGYEAVFNTNTTQTTCGAHTGRPRVVAQASELVKAVVDLEPVPAVPATSIAGSWNYPGTLPGHPEQYDVTFTQNGDAVTASCTPLNPGQKCFQQITGKIVGNTLVMFQKTTGTISPDNNTITFTNGYQWQRKGTQGGVATITLSGPDGVWFGMGFGAQDGGSNGGAGGGAEGLTMAGTNYTIVVLGNGSVMERKLGLHTPGTLLPPSLTIVNNTVVGGTRTVVMTRPFAGVTADHFSFDATVTHLDFINALGSTPDFQVHVAKGSGTMYFVELDAPTCVCNEAAGQGTIGGFAWGSQRCVGRPLGQMLDDPKWASNGRVNPTCLLKSYQGGLRCCKDGSILLDSDQDAPTETTEWQLKYRYYYEEGSTDNTDTFRTSWWTEHNNNEHDVPICKEGEECTYTITSNFTAGMMGGFPSTGEMTLIHVEGHCHIGCQRMELWIMDDPANPKPLCQTKVVYGEGDEIHNEMGYILGNLPCIFGDPKDGLQAPIVLKEDTKLMSVKVQNNTVARYGDMGLWEIRASVPRPLN